MISKPDNKIIVQDPIKRKPGRPKKQPDNGSVQHGQLAVTGSDNAITVRKKGRPKGSKNKTIRKDHDIQAAQPGKNSKAIRFSLAFSALPAIDVNNLAQVQQRITEYFDICMEYDMKPSIAALAMAFHVDRMTLFNWLNNKTGTIKNIECFYAIKNAYRQINLLYETYLNDGSIIPVSAFFLMKNNMGYKDTTDYIITSGQEKQDNISDITNRAGLLID